MPIEAYFVLAGVGCLWLFIAMSGALSVSARLRARPSAQSWKLYSLVMAALCGWLAGVIVLFEELRQVVRDGRFCVPIRGTGNMSCNSAFAAFKLAAVAFVVVGAIPFAFKVGRAASRKRQ